ncbi:MAG: hypothetical protein AMXMBFR19_21990 [Chthonomonadaceae bacterium]|uniref:Uncharacterized protein n=1 Tax=Candidatus Nitrosymbiomonas proteolyticus TaxID=2608984 RepID=A0A809R4C0_9BACT|nr:hypothetical protein NPRO_00350 [Candidatus Nitrosymbiomonas proteolyticus]GIK32376.1 MAG: hypothetical protein BroJett009_13680 [Armatimonadota bacterium]
MQGARPLAWGARGNPGQAPSAKDLPGFALPDLRYDSTPKRTMSILITYSDGSDSGPGWKLSLMRISPLEFT